MSKNVRIIPYRPCIYPFAFEAFRMQNQMHWTVSEISFQGDIKDYEGIHTLHKSVILSIFTFFVQSDIEANRYYRKMQDGNKEVECYFDDFPEVNMMKSAFSNAEAVHVDAYSTLMETLNIPNSIYSEWRDNEYLKNRQNLLTNIMNDNKISFSKVVKFFSLGQEKELSVDYSWAKPFAVFNIFLEGISLFGMFATLLHFNKDGKFQGMGQVITWSMRDENLHVSSMITLHANYLLENPKSILYNKKGTSEAYRITPADYFITLYKYLQALVFQELEFLKHQLRHIQGLFNDIKAYMLSLINDRVGFLVSECLRIGAVYQPAVDAFYKWLSEFDNSENKAPQWILDLTGKENVNFFNSTNTSYSKVKERKPSQNDFDDVLNIL